MSILFDNVSFAYSEHDENIIRDFSACFKKEKITVLTGASGVGKSTLLYLASGLYPSNGGVQNGGKVTVDGKELRDLSPSERCKTAGFMFQNPDLQFCTDTVRNELIFCLENINTPTENFERIIKDSLRFCDILHLENRELNTLSGGEKQKVALACLYAIDTKWFFLDEPFANVDKASADLLIKKLCKLHEEKGVAILCVDHRIDYWKETADESFLYENGKVIEIKPSCKDYSPDIPSVKYGETVLRTENLSVSYKEKSVLKDVTVSFSGGEICAIIGESGCGKSSFFKAITGTVKHTGKIFFSKGRKTKIGVVTQNPQDQFVADTVKDEMLICLKKDKQRETKVKEILKEIDLWRYRDASAYMLSQGQQRRLGTASLCVYDCDILLCDEPTYAQDAENTVRIMDAICSLAREKGVSVLFSTHDTALAKAYADKIYEIKDGEMYEKIKSCT